jgi:hypothetical protein
MRSNRLWIGVACGVALGLGAVVAVDAGTTPAGAQSGFTVSAEQLKINQNISSAAVKRSNRSLNYLAPIRTTQTDNADDGSNGVKALNSIPGSGQGWAVGQLARGQKQYWANVSPAGSLTASSGPASGTGAFTASRTPGGGAAGDYTVDFKTNVSACSWSVNPYFPSGLAPAGSPVAAYAAGVPGQATQVRVALLTVPVAPADGGCGMLPAVDEVPVQYFQSVISSSSPWRGRSSGRSASSTGGTTGAGARTAPIRGS